MDWKKAAKTSLALVLVVLATCPGCRPSTGPAAPATRALLPTSTAVESSPLPPATPTAMPSPRPTATRVVPLPTATPTRPVMPPQAGPIPAHLSLVRGPYLQLLPSASMLVVWETDQVASGRVLYGETDAYGQWADTVGIGTQHVVTLTGLNAYSLYHYRLQAGPFALSRDYTFRSPPAPDQTHFTFVAFGDTRSLEKPHRAVIARILTWPMDFVLHTGDLVADGNDLSQWQTFFDIEGEMLARAPLFPAMGNHEKNQPLYHALFHLPGNERWYSFDYGPAHFVCLQIDGFADIQPDSQQLAWLQADLAGSVQPWKIVFFHHPPYSSSFNDQSDEIPTRLALENLLIEGGVQLVLNGHHHNYQRFHEKGVTYVVTGGGGAPLYDLENPLDPGLVAGAVANHAVFVTIEVNKLTARSISAEGQELDRFELTLP